MLPWIPWFLQIEGLGQPRSEQVYGQYFSNSIFSLCVSLSRFGHSGNILNFFTIIMFAIMICGQQAWCYYCNCLGHHEPRPCKMVNLVHGGVPTAPATAGAPVPLPLFRPPYWLRHQTEIRPINKPARTSKWSSKESMDLANFLVVLL